MMANYEIFEFFVIMHHLIYNNKEIERISGLCFVSYFYTERF